MAIMIPADFPEAEEGSRGPESERVFFESLRDSLSDEFYVYHGLPYLEGSRAEQGEADFLVLHPHHGMLVIECKGRGVIRKPNGQWVRIGPGKRREKLSRSPSEQAKAQVSALVRKFKEPLGTMFPMMRGNFPLVYGWALAFPFATWDEVNPPPELEREVVLDSTSLDDLEGHVVRAMEFHARRWEDPHKIPRMRDPAAFHRFRTDVVSPGLDLAPKLGGQIAVERRQFVRLTEAQVRTVRALLDNERLLVPGGAGTGKTVLALHAARLIAARGRRVLLTCFNTNLADYLADSAANMPELAGTVDACSFHTLCRMAADALGRPFELARDATADEQREFWQRTAPMMLFDALAQRLLGPWDTIIVDEGQDFAKMWWDVLETGLAEKGGQLAIFYDDAQVIFDHGGHVPAAGARFGLHDNFRNTQAIAQALRKLVDVEMESHPSCPTGDPPATYEQESPARTRRQLTELLDRLLGHEALRYEQIAILTPRSPRNSSLASARKLGEHPIVHSPGRWAEGVLHTTIGKFKGLEADVVIMLDVDPRKAHSSANARYVAASRARHRLYVFSRGNWLER